MMLNWNHRIGATALAVALLASTGGFLNEAKAVETGQLLIKDKPRPAARNKSDTIKPTPPSVAKGKSATIPVELPTVAPPSAERGIKDNAIKGCSGCGMTGRVAAPPPVDDGAAPAPSVDIETGQLLDKGPRWPNKPVAARRAHSGPGGTPPSTAKGGKTGWLLGIGGLAAIIAVVAVSGSGTPVSR